MKEQLIKLAKEKGFSNKVNYKEGIFYAEDILEDNKAYYLWLCLLQRWLREKKDVFVCVESGYDRMGKYNRGFNLDVNGGSIYDDNDVFEEYEEALERGLIRGLELI